MSGGFRWCRAVLGMVAALLVGSVAACQGGSEPSGTGSVSVSSGLPSTPLPSASSSSAPSQPGLFVVDEVDDGLKVEWVSVTATDTEFTGTFRITNLTGEDVWTPSGSYVVQDEERGSYAFARVFLAPDPNVSYYVPPTSSVFLLEAGESGERRITLPVPFTLTTQRIDATPTVIDVPSARMCVGYIPASELPEGRPAEGLYNSAGMRMEDDLGASLQHVSCSESIDVE